MPVLSPSGYLFTDLPHVLDLGGSALLELSLIHIIISSISFAFPFS